MEISNAAYIAGLFDGEGSLQCKQAWEKKKKHKGKGYRKTYAWRINMEIAMTDESVIRWVHDILKFAKILWPYSQVKLHKLEQIIDHYEPRAQELGDNIVDLETERAIRKFNWNVHGT